MLDKLYALEQRGLVSKIKQANTFIFHPEDPEILLLSLVRQEQTIKNLKSKVSEAILELKTKQTKVNLPKVKYFEGKDGLIQLYEDTLKSKNTTIYGYGNFGAELKFLKGYVQDYWQKRAQAGIKLIGLIPKDEINQKMAKETNDQHLRTTYFYDPKYAVPLEIDVYDNKVIFVSFEESFGVMTESEVISKALRNLLALGMKN